MVVQQTQHLVLLGLFQLLALVLLNPLQVAVICAPHPRSTCCYIVYYYNSIYCWKVQIVLLKEIIDSLDEMVNERRSKYRYRYILLGATEPALSSAVLKTTGYLHPGAAANPSFQGPSKHPRNIVVEGMMLESGNRVSTGKTKICKMYASNKWSGRCNRITSKGICKCLSSRPGGNMILGSLLCKIQFSDRGKYGLACQVHNVGKTSEGEIKLRIYGWLHKWYLIRRSMLLNIIPRQLSTCSSISINVSLLDALSIVIHPIW